MQNALQAFVENNIDQASSRLSEQEIAAMPNLREKLGKGPRDPVYRKDIFQLLVRQAFGQR